MYCLVSTNRLAACWAAALTRLPLRAFVLAVVIPALAGLFVGGSAAAATLNVPSQFATIGAAVAAASPGDTVLVADGTYSAAGDLDISLNKAITIESVNGAASTTIDCTTDFFADVDAAATIQGFTFENADSGDLSVIDVESSDCTVSHCVFSHNSNFSGNGGAFELDGGTTAIADCTFDHDNGSGAISSSGGSATITDCMFTNCNGQSGGGGGAINLNTGTVTISGSTFNNNTGGSNAGGAIYWRNGSITVTDSTFSNNSASYGGVILEGAQGINSPATFTRCVFTGNSASIMGGVASLEGGSSGTTGFTAVDCLFIGNTAASDGAVVDGITIGSSPNKVNVTNCSFYGNNVTSGTTTGVICGGATTTTKVVNSILFGDTGPKEISNANPSASTTVTDTDIHQAAFAGSNGNINADPLYNAPASDDLHLRSGSPCIAAGTATGAPASDYFQYPWGTTISMGAISPIHFRFTMPATAIPGAAFSFDIHALAADNTTVITTYTGAVHFTSSDLGATLPADSTLTAGASTFSAIFATVGNQTITGTDNVEGAINGTSGNVSVQNGPATHFGFVTPPAAAAGVQTQITVTALDAGGNTVTNYTGTVHFTSTDGQAVLPADFTFTNGSGFFPITLKTAGSQTVTVTTTDTGLTGTTNGIEVTGGRTSHFIVSSPPSARAGTALAFTITAEDMFGNTDNSYDGLAHFSSSDPLAGVPGNSFFAGGVGSFHATFRTAGTQTITANDVRLPAITGMSDGILVAAAGTSHFQLSGPPTSTAGRGVTITVTPLDGFGNVTSYSGLLHFTSSDPQAGLQTDRFCNGITGFSATLDTAGEQTVTVTDDRYPVLTATTAPIAVAAAGTSHFILSAPPSATAGTPFTLTLTPMDAFGNTSSYSGLVHFTSTDGAAILPRNYYFRSSTVLTATLTTPVSQTITANDVRFTVITGTTDSITIEP